MPRLKLTHEMLEQSSPKDSLLLLIKERQTHVRQYDPLHRQLSFLRDWVEVNLIDEEEDIDK